MAQTARKSAAPATASAPATWTPPPGTRVVTVAETHGAVIETTRGWTKVRLDHTGIVKAYRPDTLRPAPTTDEPTTPTDQPTTTDPRRTSDRPICCAECGSDTPADQAIGDCCPECAGRHRITAAAPTVTREQAAKLAQRPTNEARPLGTPTPTTPRKAKPILFSTSTTAATPDRLLRHAVGHLAVAEPDADTLAILVAALDRVRTEPAPVAPTAPTVARQAKAPKAPKEPRPCLCGCGELTASSFRMGHDARFHGWMKRIADGKLDPATLPASAVALMTLVGGMPTTDYDGSAWTR